MDAGLQNKPISGRFLSAAVVDAAASLAQLNLLLPLDGPSSRFTGVQILDSLAHKNLCAYVRHMSQPAEYDLPQSLTRLADPLLAPPRG